MLPCTIVDVVKSHYLRENIGEREIIVVNASNKQESESERERERVGDIASRDGDNLGNLLIKKGRWWKDNASLPCGPQLLII
jgi:hypothetical protein